jgi:hypothetical protein
VSDQPTNDVSALRGLLFDTLRDLRDKEKPMEVDRARAISDVAKVLVDSARVEVEHMKLTNSNGSGFIPLEDKTPRAVEPGAPRLVAGKAQSGSR